MGWGREPLESPNSCIGRLRGPSFWPHGTKAMPGPERQAGRQPTQPWAAFARTLAHKSHPPRRPLRHRQTPPPPPPPCGPARAPWQRVRRSSRRLACGRGGWRVVSSAPSWVKPRGVPARDQRQMWRPRGGT
jgi:hypothetical protein